MSGALLVVTCNCSYGTRLPLVRGPSMRAGIRGCTLRHLIQTEARKLKGKPRAQFTRRENDSAVFFSSS